ncbi:MAG: butyrate kinase [Rikenellaceae bacterium]
MNQTILAINPGSTSTKIALFEGEELKFQHNVVHSAEELRDFSTVASQFSLRKGAVVSELKEMGVELTDIDAVIGRGGLIYPLESGIYEVNELMKQDLHNPPYGEHASNLGGLIAEDLAAEITELKGEKVHAYIADPVVVDELQDVARISGHPNFERNSIFHALNQKAIARKYAKDKGKKYEELNLIVAHLGGGISVGAHRNGRVVDVNNALDGEGAFSPERSGTLPAGQLVKCCFSGKYTQDEIKKMLKGNGGLVAYLGTNDGREARAMVAAGDKKAALVLDAMNYQISKLIGEMAVVLCGKVDAIIVTGGLAHSKSGTAAIREQAGWIAPVEIYAGEDEMGALASSALRVLSGECAAREYLGKKN